MARNNGLISAAKEICGMGSPNLQSPDCRPSWLADVFDETRSD
jgi:hypothetical protein